MFCTGCGAKLSEDPFCSKCGRARPSTQPETPASAITVEREKVLRRHGEAQFGLAIAFAILLSLRFSIFGGLKWPETIGATIGTLLIPFILGYAIARKKGWNSIGNWTLGFVILVAVSANAGRTATKSESGEQMAARIMNDVINSQPTRGDYEEQILRAIFEEYIGRIRDIHREYSELHLEKLYEVETFANHSNISKLEDDFRKLERLHEQSANMMPMFTEIVERRLREAGVEADKRSRFVSTAAVGVGKASVKMKRWLDSEQAWIDKTRPLLEFAAAHHSDLGIEGGKIVISDSAVRQEFSMLWKNSAEAYDAMNEALAAQRAAAQSAMKAQGVDADKLLTGQ